MCFENSFIRNLLWSIGECVSMSFSPEAQCDPFVSSRYKSDAFVYVIHTCPKADDCAQAVSASFHDDRGKDFPTQKAVLNASSERIETLVTQHGKLVVHRATRHGQLQHTWHINLTVTKRTENYIS